MGGMRRLLVLLSVLALAGCGSSKQAATTATTAAPEPATTSAPVAPKPQPIDPLRHPAGEVAVRLSAPTHRPKVGAPWRYTVLVTAGGKPQPARIYLQITFRKAVVGTLGSHLVTNGRWAETIRWPVSAKGRTLAFEAKVVSNGRTGGAAYPVRAR